MQSQSPLASSTNPAFEDIRAQRKGRVECENGSWTGIGDLNSKTRRLTAGSSVVVRVGTGLPWSLNYLLDLARQLDRGLEAVAELQPLWSG